MRFLKLAEEQVFTLQRAAYGPAHGLPDRPRQPDQQRVWQRHDIGWRLAPQPACQLPDYLGPATAVNAKILIRRLRHRSPATGGAHPESRARLWFEQSVRLR